MTKMGPFPVRFLLIGTKNRPTSGSLERDQNPSHLILQIQKGRLTVPPNWTILSPKTMGRLLGNSLTVKTGNY